MEPKFTDVMVDIETTGTNPDRSAMIQLAAVKFNIDTGEIDHGFFDRSLRIPAWRSWDPDTQQWWNNSADKRRILQEILFRAEDPAVVMADFVKWAAPAGSLRFWSKPTHFDYMFVSSYVKDFNLPQMFSFREATDLNSYLRGLYFPALDLMDMVQVPFEGDAHNALMDSLHQVAMLFANVEARKQLVLPPYAGGAGGSGHVSMIHTRPVIDAEVVS